MVDARFAQRNARPGWPWHVRIPIKWAIFALVVLLVCYPDPRLLVRNLDRVRDFNALVEPHHPDIAAMAARFRDRFARSAAPPATPAEIQRAVERFVLDEVAYAWDWDQWGAADYAPTLDEIRAAAAQRSPRRWMEDCDGRAVVCASLLRAMGFDARIVTDLRHVWVETPEARLMGPGATRAVVSDATGTHIDYASALASIPRSLSYGIAVFPFAREAVVWLALVLLSLHPAMPRSAIVAGALLTLQGWLFIRCGVITTPDQRWLDQSWPGIVGMLHVVAGLGILWYASARARRRLSRSARDRV